jgi:hypothetical protein
MHFGNGWLIGHGTTGALDGFTALMPGSSLDDSGTGILNTGNLAAGFEVYLDIAGGTAGTYDQINVAGTVDLGTDHLTLSVAPSLAPTRGQVLVLVNNDGTDPVTGHFHSSSGPDEYPEGKVLTLNGYQFQLSYAGGDGNDVTLTALTGKEPTTTTVVSSASPSNPGQPVIFTASVASTGPPSGIVLFLDGPATLGSGSLSSGSATFGTSTLTSGLHSITARYAGDAGFAESTSAVLTQAVRYATTTSLSSTAEANCGSAVTYMVTVSSPGGTPSGGVTFYDGAAVLGTSALAAGSATYTTSSLSGGAHSITAAYGGDVAFAPSTSPSAATTIRIITAQPQTSSACLNTAASFSVTASGADLTYQWRKGGSNIPNANAATYTIAAALPSDEGTYDVLVAGSCGSVTSSAATLTVNSLTAISVQPSSVTADVGMQTSFAVTAAGTGLTYQWRRNSANIPGANAAGYVIASVTPGDAGSYDVVVTGACGSVTSVPATLTVHAPPPTIVGIAPASGSQEGGQVVTITGTALTGATVTIGGNVAFVHDTTTHSATFIAPAHDRGVVDVTVSTVGGSATMPGAFTYLHRGDANGDGKESTADIVYLINFLFAGGPASADGDFNGNGTVGVDDIVDLINDLFPEKATASASLRATNSAVQPQATLRLPALRGSGPLVSVPVFVNMMPTSVLGTPGAMGRGLQAISMEIDFGPAASIGEIKIQRAGPLEYLHPLYEVSLQHEGRLFYLVCFDQATNPIVISEEVPVATIDVAIKEPRLIGVRFNPALTLLSNQQGTIGLTALTGTLILQDGSIDPGLGRRHAAGH